MHSMPSTRKPSAKPQTDWEPLQAIIGGIVIVLIVIAVAALVLGATSLFVMWMVGILTAGAFTITFMQAVAGVLLASVLGTLIGRVR